VLDVRDLLSREGDDTVARVVPIGTVEDVEIAPGGAQDDDSLCGHGIDLSKSP
jgi:hypothetical protein